MSVEIRLVAVLLVISIFLFVSYLNMKQLIRTREGRWIKRKNPKGVKQNAEDCRFTSLNVTGENYCRINESIEPGDRCEKCEYFEQKVEKPMTIKDLAKWANYMVELEQGDYIVLVPCDNSVDGFKQAENMMPCYDEGIVEIF